MTAILFDLDGTLVDSSPGILNAFQYTFKQMNHIVPDASLLSTYIGPPLETTFRTFFENKDQVEQAILHFRAFYKESGIYQVSVYDDIETLLRTLVQEGFDLYVTTSKHEPMAIQMLTNLGIADYFTGVFGSTSVRYHKADVIQACLQTMSTSAQNPLIIGDTKFDIIGGKQANLTTIGVTWGFGSQEELQLSKADYIVKQPLDIYTLLQNLSTLS
ncbi:HAD hydrolase-like protein [Streptococcus dysgalactiae]|uniref:HAD hydrolase-like protein n=1 Tax=Streptococcus dysgalactiae TaxID=1334 RepID=UPI00128D0B20|nr:HAD hydrolase-like protein [Streptococcus dysgalactiae]MQA58024.1 HAD hydrolase-like protein [Streptococcus dysgalactiae]GET74503.1 phosphoglycolate phosphatase [Streptococcus dysgalactiae subsp. equisimilis]